MRKEKDRITIFPDQFEQKVRGFITSLRLFARGDVYTPLAIVNKFGINDLYFSGIFEGDLERMVLDEEEVKRFQSFYEHTDSVVNQIYLEAQTNKKLYSWYKRLNNAIFFFNQTYFSKNSNRLDMNARAGNDVRLINLTTALDALCGTGGGAKNYTDRLSDRCALVIGSLGKNVKQRISHFYELRSNYIHANQDKIVSRISNDEIQELKSYVQKLILINLAFLGSESLKKKILDSGVTHYFEYLEKVPNPAELPDIFNEIKKWDDQYGIPAGKVFRNPW